MKPTPIDPSTTPQVLGKGDFKSLLKWRLKMRGYREAMLQAAKAMEGEGGAADGEAGEAEEGKGKKGKKAPPKSAVEDEVRCERRQEDV